MRCPICGTKNKNDAVECVACGSALTTSTSEAQSEKTTTQKKNGSNRNSNKNKKSGKNTQNHSEQVSTEENVNDTASEQGVIPSVVIIGKEKEHIPMNIEYTLESEKYLEEDEDDDDEEDDENEGMFWNNKKTKTAKPLISGSDTVIYICMGILGFLLVFAISYLAINVVLQDMNGESQPSTSIVAEHTTESSSVESETSTSGDDTEQSSDEQTSSYDREPWVWEDTYKVEIIDGEVYLLEYLGKEEIVKIPSEFDGYPLTMIEAYAFLDCTSIKAVEVPEGVTYIGEYAFAECTNLRVIALPDSLENIGEYAFDGIGEKIVVFSSGNSYGFRLELQKPDNFKWNYGKGLPENLSQWIEEETTTEEITTPEVTTPEETTQEQTTTQQGNSGTIPSTSDFAHATYPASGTYTTVDGYEADWIFRTLTLANGSQEVVVVKYRGAGGVVTIPSEYNGVPVRYIGKAAFQNATNITELIIPDSVVYIEYHGMADMTGCTSITIPASVTFIYENSFECSAGTVIKVKAGSYAHAYCNEHPELTYQVQ